MGMHIQSADVVDEANKIAFLVVLVVLTIGLCYNLGLLTVRYYSLIKEEKGDKKRKDAENMKDQSTREVWYLEEELRKEIEHKKKMKMQRKLAQSKQ